MPNLTEKVTRQCAYNYIVMCTPVHSVWTGDTKVTLNPKLKLKCASSGDRTLVTPDEGCRSANYATRAPLCPEVHNVHSVHVLYIMAFFCVH